MESMENIKTLQQAIVHFSEYENCHALMVILRWPDGEITCPYCGSTKLTYLAKNRVWKCYSGHSRPKFSLKTGTIFEDSPLGLDKWLTTLWLLVNCKNGVSSLEISRAIGITQKSTWFMCHRLRLALQAGGFGKLSGEVEIDETFIGGKSRNMHKAMRERKIKGTGGADKEIVMGMVERGGKVRVMHVDTRRKKELQALIRESIEADSAIFSDALKSYDGLEVDYRHAVVDHDVQYVRGNVHTNTMENFWSLLKRGLHGTYISVEPFHLFRYLDEQAFRYNNRKEMNDQGRFVLALSQIGGKRLTYKALTGKDQEVSPAGD
jgi:transposase-like protein